MCVESLFFKVMGRTLAGTTESKNNVQSNFSIESKTVAGNKATKSKATKL